MPEEKEIDIDYFKKIKLVVGKVVSAESIENSNKLMKIRVSLGDREKTILAGIKNSYKPEELTGKKIIIIDNIKHAKLMGLESEGMLLAASDGEGNLSLLTVDNDIKEGSSIS
ncbi:MAG: methionine--tRNA ligase subunit beta [Candidatus Parvarchaeota archaeon]|nr:methionine--tRNA ligase subunit beta [Candidatus Parvarchaeota archaeon]